ncbi:MAG: low temperature requirement protein A [Actinomycetales bacterium]|nr:low temperature requirement protein A [Candidatus Phosphoribacter baldrii]
MTTRNETPWVLPLSGRDPREKHRASTPLELLFDLTFVVAIATAAAQLHHGLSEGHWSAITGYLLTFFAIWWAWMNFTWFASAYDTNDVLWRTLAMVMMAGVLVLAAGVPRAFNEGQFGVLVFGYAIMRTPMIVQWLRVARDDPSRRETARAYAVGIGVLEIAWLTWGLVVGQAGGYAVLLTLIALEVLVPIVAERRGGTPWHPEHMVERYSLMTIIVLGEVLLSTTGGINAVLAEGSLSAQLLLAVVGAMLIVFVLWWFYFKHSHAERMEEEENHSTFVWAYGHYLVYAAAAAVGAGLGASIDVIEHVAHVSSRAAALTLGVPVAAYVLVVAYLQARDVSSWRSFLRAAATAGAVLAVSVAGLEVGLTVLLIGVVLAVALAFYLVSERNGYAVAVNEANAAAGKAVEH